MQVDLTEGKLFSKMMKFAIPYLIACFLQTFYGMADLFVIGRFSGAAPVTAVSIGSQVMHLLTVVIVGLAMGTTVSISRSIGAGEREKTSRFIGNSIVLFAVVSLLLTALLLVAAKGILTALSTPVEAFPDAVKYTAICFAGIPFIVAYNVISSIFRGMGDSKSPMFFVGFAGIINIGLDFLLIGPCNMGAAGAAVATIGAQGLAVLVSLIYLVKKGKKEENAEAGSFGIRLSKADLRPDREILKTLLGIGAPIALQDGLIQISFLVITAIANGRGVAVAAAVGIVEKVICFLFLVPSAMLSTVSVVAAQNAGAGKHDRSKKALGLGILTVLVYGLMVFIICLFSADWIVGNFVTGEPEVVRLGGQYLRTYAVDTMIAGVHFCFSGYFSAYEKSLYSFIHNMISVVAVRIPGAYLAAVFFPTTLYAMGLAAPAGSLLSIFICLFLYGRLQKKLRGQATCA